MRRPENIWMPEPTQTMLRVKMAPRATIVEAAAASPRIIAAVAPTRAAVAAMPSAILVGRLSSMITFSLRLYFELAM